MSKEANVFNYVFYGLLLWVFVIHTSCSIQVGETKVSYSLESEKGEWGDP